jgi:AP2-associated kinase
VTYLASSVLQTAPDVHEVLILLELYTGGRVIDMMNARLKTGFPEEEVLRIFTDVCQAVARLHHRTKPIIHRDLKVENILRDSHGNYLLCDYGSCTVKMMHPEVLGAALCEEQIARFTTMPYRAPEMVSLYSGSTITTKADVWALGCLLFKLCFFTTPFGEHPLAIVSGTFCIPDKSKYSEPLHSLIRYMLEPNTDKRPNIWQVSEVAFRIRKLKNPIKNVFHSSPPPLPLPTAPRSHTGKTTPSNQSQPKARIAEAAGKVVCLSQTAPVTSPRAGWRDD